MGIDRLLQDRYPTQCWQAGEVVVDSYPLSFEELIPDGVYQLHLGLYPDRPGGYTIPLQLVEAGQALDITSIHSTAIQPILANRSGFQVTIWCKKIIPLPFSYTGKASVCLFDSPQLWLF